ncbi:OPT oligopeptide transporter protein-domain-containing protein [Aspergillus insuetus]
METPSQSSSSDGTAIEEPDPFAPFPDSQPDQRRILTFRAILVGSLCGTLVNASNIYLGLKAGWTTSANIFGSIVGFVVLKQWSTSSFSDHAFGPHENNIVQTVATAARGLSGVFVSAVPALYQLGTLKTPGADYYHLTLLTGLVRNFFLVLVAHELDLRFPSSTATATTIRSMHQAVEGGIKARRKLRVMVIAFVAALILRAASQYAIGILWDWHPFTWMVTSGIAVSAAMSLESWGWYIEWTPAFIGSGMLVSVNVAVSFLAGSVLAWGIIGPILVSNGMTFGQHRSNEGPWMDLMSYTSLSKELATADSSESTVLATLARDTTPLGTLSKVSQVILGGVNRQPSVEAAQRLNLVGGALTNIGASQATDLMGDFRRVIAVAATEPTLPIPRSSLIFSIVMGIVGPATVLVRYFILVDKWAYARKYHPNFMILAMAFTLPATHYGIAMVIGALVAAEFGAAVAAGEGIGGSVNALLSILGVGGEGWGTGVGCPAGRC